MKILNQKQKALQKQPQTLEEWAGEYLAQRGIDLKAAKESGDVVVVDAVAARRAGHQGLPGLLFKNYDPFTGEERPCSQLRPMTPKKGGPKFLNRAGVDAHPFFSRNIDCNKEKRSTKKCFVITEGPTRPQAGAARGYAVIALSGVDAHGAGDELSPDLAALAWKGREVFIVFDADAVTNSRVRSAEQRLAKKLRALGAKVYIVRIPAFIAKAGFDDLMARPGGAEAFEMLCEAAKATSTSESNHATPTLQTVADVEDKQTAFLSPPRLPLGMLVGMEGMPGEGKTTAALDLSAKGSKGLDVFSRTKISPFSTIYWSAENPDYIIKAKLKEMGADLKKIHLLTGAKNPDGSERSLTIADIPVLRAALAKTNAKLFIIDPLQSVMGAGVDSHKANETRPLLDALAKLAHELGVCILIIRHLAKGGSGRAVTRGLGSIDITGALRSSLTVGTASDDPSKRALFHTKSNVGPMAEPIGFVIEGKGDACCVHWTGKTDISLSDITAPETNKRRNQVEEAEEYLKQALADDAKPMTELQKESGFSTMVLFRASVHLNIVKTRPDGLKGKSWWALPTPKKFTKRE